MPFFFLKLLSGSHGLLEKIQAPLFHSEATVIWSLLTSPALLAPVYPAVRPGGNSGQGNKTTVHLLPPLTNLQARNCSDATLFSMPSSRLPTSDLVALATAHVRVALMQVYWLLFSVLE